MVKQVFQRFHAISIPGDTKNTALHDPKQPNLNLKFDLTSKLALLQARGETNHITRVLPSQLFSNSVLFKCFDLLQMIWSLSGFIFLYTHISYYLLSFMLGKTTYMQKQKKNLKKTIPKPYPFIEALWEICFFFYQCGF